MCLIKVKREHGEDIFIPNRPVTLTPQTRRTQGSLPSRRSVQPIAPPSRSGHSRRSVAHSGHSLGLRPITPETSRIPLGELPIIEHIAPRSSQPSVHHTSYAKGEGLPSQAYTRSSKHRAVSYGSATSNRQQGPRRSGSVNYRSSPRQSNVVVHSPGPLGTGADRSPVSPKQSTASHRTPSHRSTRESFTIQDENGEKRKVYRRSEATR